nr:LysE family transporter [Ochrovirga pacifica]
MSFLVSLFSGYIIAALGSITPSFLNLTIVKTSLKNGKRSAIYLVVGFITVLFFQANIGAYLANVLMKNSEYLTTIQKIATGIVLLLSVNFFRLHFKSSKKVKKKRIPKSKAYLHGVGMALLNMFAIPFYFTIISFLISMDYFSYSIQNSLIFSVGSSLGSFTTYVLYAVIASNVKDKLTYVATKMDLILGFLTGVVGLINIITLLR